jgi:branched-subunit amino acid aminotransferase/4-amino-4-deoxychorismate lyase
VTRRLIIEAAQNDNITVVEKALHKDQLAQYNGAFASNAASGIVPIAAVDDTHFDVNDALIQRATALYEKTATTAV